MAHVNPFMYLLNTDADQAEKSTDFGVDIKRFALISNDSDATITFTFNAASSADDDQLVLLAGEKLENIPMRCESIYYKAAGADNKNFRCYGVIEEV